jgi:hypothetical protein
MARDAPCGAGDRGRGRAPSVWAEVRAARDVEDHEPVDAATTFTSGDQVWIWSRVHGAKGSMIRHMWKRNGAYVWVARLLVRSDRWTSHSRRAVSPGVYSVEVRAEGDTLLGEVSFTVR